MEDFNRVGKIPDSIDLLQTFKGELMKEVLTFNFFL